MQDTQFEAAGRRRQAGVLAGVSVALLAGLGVRPAPAATDMLELRERLEVERPKLRAALAPFRRAPEATAFPADKPGVAWGKYLNETWRVLDARTRFPEVQAALKGFRGRLDPRNATQRQALGVLLGDYLQVRYADDLRRELGTLVAFRTFNNVVDRNSDNAQMRKCFDYLTALATGLGLQVQNHGYETLQITLPATGGAAAAAPLGLWTHADVPRPIEHKWASAPFELRASDERWFGVGVRDDKGPLVVQLFALRVLRDAGLQLQRPVVLLVSSSGEEPAHDAAADVARLATRPALVLAADGEFPYATGELGRLVARVASTRGMKTRTGIRAEQFWIHKLDCGQGPSTVPSEARAWVRYVPPPHESNPQLVMSTKFRHTIEAWQKDHTASVYEIYIQDDTLHYFVYGRPEHVQRADRAINSIYDLAGSLGELPLYPNSASDILAWITDGLQRDPSGKALGLEAADPELGGCWASPVGFDRLGEEVAVLVDLRWPPPHDSAWMRTKMQEAVAVFARKNAMQLRVDWEPGGHDPARIDPPASAREALAEAYALASGEAAEPVGATASSARLLPATVPFGPEWPRSEVRGHERDESLSRRELQDLGVAYLAALATLAAGPLPGANP